MHFHVTKTMQKRELWTEKKLLLSSNCADKLLHLTKDNNNSAFIIIGTTCLTFFCHLFCAWCVLFPIVLETVCKQLNAKYHTHSVATLACFSNRQMLLLDEECLSFVSTMSRITTHWLLYYNTRFASTSLCCRKAYTVYI